MNRLVAGIQPVRESLRAHGVHVERVMIERGHHPQLEGLGRLAESLGVRVEPVSRAELDRVTAGARHQGAVAWVPDLVVRSLSSLELSESPLLVALDEIQDPQNFGAVVRSAVAFRGDAIIWPEHASAPLSAATVRASAGAIEHAVLCRVPSLVGAIEDLAARGVPSIALDAAAPAELSELDLGGPVMLVVGSEGKGLRRSVRKAVARMARLPMRGPVASLNASVAVAIALYEVVRQRAAKAPSSPLTAPEIAPADGTSEDDSASE